MLTAIVITRNEEEKIRTCLESIKWVDEIIVADTGSTDKTIGIAKTYTNKILSCKGSNFSEWRNEAMEKALGEWVFYIDADERVLDPLKNELLSICASSTKSAFAFSRKNIIFGEAVSYGPYKKDWMIKMFKKSDFETWVGRVHEYGKFKGELGYTKNSLLHLTHRNVDQFISKSLEWSKIDAKLRLEAKHPRMTGLRFLRIVFTELFNQGIIRRGFFGGTVGVIDSLLQTFSMLITYIRLWEMQQTKPLDEVYSELDEKLIKNGFKL